MTPTPEQLLPILQECWSNETSGQWLLENPARGQCNVTSLVVLDFCGGDILKTKAPGGWHFYNRVDGKRFDLTASQFSCFIKYNDVESNRLEALAGTREERYAILKARVEQHLGRRQT